VKRDRGFTLLEVMIALAIMAGVILTVISSFNYHLSMVERDRQETMAVLLARAKMDDPTFKPGDGGSGTFAPDRPDMTWKAESRQTEYPGINRVALTVSWDAEQRKVVLVQYVAK
jgi:general secretion pathway protein I